MMRHITILHLYPREMNLYGDHGNVLVLRRRLEWRGIGVTVIDHEPGDPIPEHVDIIFGGGGQDSGQGKIEDDLRAIGPKLKQMVEDGTPALVICGLYQLFGNYFETKDGEKLGGIGVFNLYTKGADVRMIGNITLHSDQFGDLIGYENHSGLTYLGEGMQPFASVVSGAGNNNEDKKEGCFYKNCIGTYLHGPLLPKNPEIADWLIETALKRQGADPTLEKLDDSVENAAKKVAMTRPR